MIAKEHINADIPFIRLSDTLDYALSIMEDYKFSQLPVVSDEHKLIGILDENSLLNQHDFSLSIETILLRAKEISIGPNVHIYEVLRYSVDYETSIVPITGDNDLYIGSIGIFGLVSILSELNAVRNKGAILVLDIKQRDYSLSEIARIAEDSNLQILSSGITQNIEEPTRIYVTLKFNQEIIQSAISSFSRYDYTITATFQGNTPDDDKDRLDHLFKYLDI